MQCIWLCRTNTRSRLEHRRRGGGGGGGGGGGWEGGNELPNSAKRGMGSRTGYGFEGLE